MCIVYIYLHSCCVVCRRVLSVCPFAPMPFGSLLFGGDITVSVCSSWLMVLCCLAEGRYCRLLSICLSVPVTAGSLLSGRGAVLLLSVRSCGCWFSAVWQRGDITAVCLFLWLLVLCRLAEGRYYCCLSVCLPVCSSGCWFSAVWRWGGVTAVCLFLWLLVLCRLAEGRYYCCPSLCLSVPVAVGSLLSGGGVVLLLSVCSSGCRFSAVWRRGSITAVCLSVCFSGCWFSAVWRRGGITAVCLSVSVAVGSLLSGGRLRRPTAAAVPATSGAVRAVSHVPLPVRGSTCSVDLQRASGVADHRRQPGRTSRHPRHSPGEPAELTEHRTVRAAYFRSLNWFVT